LGTFTQYLIANRTFKHWLIVDKTKLINDEADYANGKLEVINSSLFAGPQLVPATNAAVPSSPIISIG
jgi:hypothetical protein